MEMHLFRFECAAVSVIFESPGYTDSLPFKTFTVIEFNLLHTLALPSCEMMLDSVWMEYHRHNMLNVVESNMEMFHLFVRALRSITITMKK